MINRVMVKPDGTAVPPDRAQMEYGITPDVVFTRDDGWTLGAPSHLEGIAEHLWRGRWIDRTPVTDEDDHWGIYNC